MHRRRHHPLIESIIATTTTMAVSAKIAAKEQSSYGSVPITDEEDTGGSLAFQRGDLDTNGSNRSHGSSASGLRESLRLLVNHSLIFPGEACSIHDLSGNATISSEVANIAKNLIGGGVLSLSGGIALCSNSPGALVPASLWILVVGAIFAYSCLLIAKVCHLTDSCTFRECWERTMGERGGAAVAVVNALKPALGNLAYSAILSQTLQSLLETAGWNVSRVACLFAITVTAILPLCLLKNLAVLAPFSVLGTAAILFAALSMVIRCIDGSYQPGGTYHEDITANMRPDFGDRNRAGSLQILPLLCMIFESFVSSALEPL